MEYKHLENLARTTVDACAKKRAVLITAVDGFPTDQDALCLRDMLCYARDKGVEVILVPHDPTPF